MSARCTNPTRDRASLQCAPVRRAAQWRHDEVRRMAIQNAAESECSLCAAARRFARDESGVTAIEYGLLAALIVVVASGAIALMGGGANGLWTRVRDAVLSALP